MRKFLSRYICKCGTKCIYGQRRLKELRSYSLSDEEILESKVLRRKRIKEIQAEMDEIKTRLDKGIRLRESSAEKGIEIFISQPYDSSMLLSNYLKDTDPESFSSAIQSELLTITSSVTDAYVSLTEKGRKRIMEKTGSDGE